MKSNQAAAPPSRRHAGTPLLPTLGVVAVLGIAWAAYAYWPESAGLIAEESAERAVTPSPLAASPGKSRHTHPVERAPIRHEGPVFESTNTAIPPPPAWPGESYAPCVELATEQSVLQALDEPDEDTRFERLQQAIGDGAELPVDRMQEVLETDPSDKVRELALGALTQHPDASRAQIRAVAESALANTSLPVRTHAARLLEQMNELERIDRESGEMQSEM